MQPPIQRIAEKLIEARGFLYQMDYKTLKIHIRGLSDTDFLAEMVRVDNADIFRILWSIGLTSRQQEIALARWKELKG